MIIINGTIQGITIDKVDESIFSRKYFGRCLENCCDDVCCSYGCTLDSAERDQLLGFAAELEPLLGISASSWFEADLVADADYPSGQCIRTQVYDGRCVFVDRKNRGCTLHKFAIGKGMDPHRLKPMICLLFPVTWEKGRLFVSSFLDELPCNEEGMSVFTFQKEELRFYLGDEFVSGLEAKASGRL